MSDIEHPEITLSFWECGHVEIDDGSEHECDGRDVCVAEWRRYVPASALQGAVKRCEDAYHLLQHGQVDEARELLAGAVDFGRHLRSSGGR